VLEWLNGKGGSPVKHLERERAKKRLRAALNPSYENWTASQIPEAEINHDHNQRDGENKHGDFTFDR